MGHDTPIKIISTETYQTTNKNKKKQKTHIQKAHTHTGDNNRHLQQKHKDETTNAQNKNCL